MKSFTIIIPTYNSERYIKNCLESLINLDYDKSKVQVLVIDDGSNDSTYQVVRPFLKHNMIQYYLKQNQHWGSVINFVKNHKLARNDYISILDADDQLLPNALKIVNNESNDADLFVGSFYKWDGTRKVKKIHPYWFIFKRRLTDKQRMNSPYCLPLTYFVKKEIFYRVNSLQEGVAYQDPDYISQLVYNSNDLVFTRKAVGLYYFNRIGNSISQEWNEKRFKPELNACNNCIKNDAQEIVSYRLNLKGFRDMCKKTNTIFNVDRKMKFKWYPWYLRIIYSLIHKIRFNKFFIYNN